MQRSKTAGILLFPCYGYSLNMENKVKICVGIAKSCYSYKILRTMISTSLTGLQICRSANTFFFLKLIFYLHTDL